MAKCSGFTKDHVVTRVETIGPSIVSFEEELRKASTAAKFTKNVCELPPGH